MGSVLGQYRLVGWIDVSFKKLKQIIRAGSDEYGTTYLLYGDLPEEGFHFDPQVRGRAFDSIRGGQGGLSGITRF